MEATTIANCNEFIDRGALEKLDDSPANLIDEMEEKKAKMIEVMGETKYKADLEVLKKLQELEVKKGGF